MTEERKEYVEGKVDRYSDRRRGLHVFEALGVGVGQALADWKEGTPPDEVVKAMQLFVREREHMGKDKVRFEEFLKGLAKAMAAVKREEQVLEAKGK